MSIDKLNESLAQIKPIIDRYVAMCPDVARIINSCPRACVLMSLGKENATAQEPDPLDEMRHAVMQRQLGMDEWIKRNTFPEPRKP